VPVSKIQYRKVVNALILYGSLSDEDIGAIIDCSRKAINGRRYRLKHLREAKYQKRKYEQSVHGRKVTKQTQSKYLAKFAKNNARSNRPYSLLENDLIASDEFPLTVISEVCQRPTYSFSTQRKKIKKRRSK